MSDEQIDETSPEILKESQRKKHSTVSKSKGVYFGPTTFPLSVKPSNSVIDAISKQQHLVQTEEDSEPDLADLKTNSRISSVSSANSPFDPENSKDEVPEVIYGDTTVDLSHRDPADFEDPTRTTCCTRIYLAWIRFIRSYPCYCNCGKRFRRVVDVRAALGIDCMIRIGLLVISTLVFAVVSLYEKIKYDQVKGELLRLREGIKEGDNESDLSARIAISRNTMSTFFFASLFSFIHLVGYFVLFAGVTKSSQRMAWIWILTAWIAPLPCLMQLIFFPYKYTELAWINPLFWTLLGVSALLWLPMELRMTYYFVYSLRKDHRIVRDQKYVRALRAEHVRPIIDMNDHPECLGDPITGESTWRIAEDVLMSLGPHGLNNKIDFEDRFHPKFGDDDHLIHHPHHVTRYGLKVQRPEPQPVKSNVLKKDSGHTSKGGARTPSKKPKKHHVNM